MFDKIIYLSDNMAHVSLVPNKQLSFNVMNMHVVFQDSEKCILGEIEDIDEKIVKVRFLGEFNNNKFISGTIRKPLLNANVRLINKEEIPFIMGENTNDNMFIGTSPLYNNFPIFCPINDLFSNHMAIFGNTGSGKSYGVSRILQNVFENPKLPPLKAIFIIFDAYGEYHTAFGDINKINPNFNFKFYSTNEEDSDGEKLRIPPWLLTVDDLALLLRADTHSQIPILEKTLRLSRVFAEKSANSSACQDYLIARAIVNIMYNNQTAMNKRNDIFTILNTCQTPNFNIETIVQGVGYTRKLRECFEIDINGKFAETVLLNSYLSKFLNPEADNYIPTGNNPYSLKDIEKALDFALISDGVLNNPKSYGDAITLKVRLHSIVNSENARFFNYSMNEYVSLEKFIASLVSKEGKRAQIINFNLEDIDDSLAKVLTKVFSRMFFEFTKGLENRATIPFNVFLEEAHRYVQNDNDVYLLGYNIFERIAKEGRKYGLIYNLISQRPVELSETVISQCTNFFIFKMSHPRDIEFIKKMLPNINNEIVEKQKSLQPGTCVAFGRAFKVPQIIKMPLPDPAPSSNSCDIVNRWRG